MRVLAPMPENASTLTVRGGYQVCARCGEILTEGDSAVTVTRLSNWSIYTHEVGANCPAKAVRGWLAVRTADSMRRLPNQGPATEGQAYRLAGVLRPCMSLLDESHIDAELDLAEYQPSDELQILPSSDARGRRNDFFEDDLIEAIDANLLGAYLQILNEIVWSCRSQTYAAMRGAAFIEWDGIRRLVSHPKKNRPKITARLPQVNWDVMSWGTSGKPVEFARYSKNQFYEIEGGSVCEFEQRERKPERLDLGYSSTTVPEAYFWQRNGEWDSWTDTDTVLTPPVDSGNPYGPIARLHPHNIRLLNEQRNAAFRGENIECKGQIEAERLDEAQPNAMLATAGTHPPG